MASRGIATLPALLATVALGAAAGIGGYTFVYAKHPEFEMWSQASTRALA